MERQPFDSAGADPRLAADAFKGLDSLDIRDSKASQPSEAPVSEVSPEPEIAVEAEPVALPPVTENIVISPEPIPTISPVEPEVVISTDSVLEKEQEPVTVNKRVVMSEKPGDPVKDKGEGFRSSPTARETLRNRIDGFNTETPVVPSETPKPTSEGKAEVNPKDGSSESKEKTEKISESISVSELMSVSGPLNLKNRSFFGKMSEGAKSLVGQMYEGLYKIPGVNRIVGKMEIAYNEMWSDKHERKAAVFKGRIDDVDVKMKALDGISKQTGSIYSKLEGMGVSGSTVDRQFKERDIEDKKRQLLNERQKLEGRFTDYENRAKLRINARDQIADKLINNYDKTLEPLKEKLRSLDVNKADLERTMEQAKINEEDKQTKISALEKDKQEIITQYELLGFSRRKIEKDQLIRNIDNGIAQTKAKLAENRQDLLAKQNDISRAIAEASRKAQPYRNKRDEFLRIKNRRLIDMDVSRTVPAKEFTSREEVDSGSWWYNEGIVNTESEGEEAVEEITAPESKEKEIKIKAKDLISQWNAFLGTKNKAEAKEKEINLKSFLTSSGLKDDQELDLEKTRTLVWNFYRSQNNKLPEKEDSKFKSYFNDFIKKIQDENKR